MPHYAGHVRVLSELVKGAPGAPEQETTEERSVKITMESTNQLTQIDGVTVRLWHGVTDKGTKCEVFVRVIAVHKLESQAEFERELREQMPPANDRVISLRHIL